MSLDDIILGDHCAWSPSPNQCHVSHNCILITQHPCQFLLYRKPLAIAANICRLVYLFKLTLCKQDLTPNAISLRSPKIHTSSMTEIKNPTEERPRKKQDRAQNAITFTLSTILLLTLRMFSESTPTHSIPSQSHWLPPNSPESLQRPSPLPSSLINLRSEWSTLDLSYFGSPCSRHPWFLLSLGWVARSWQRSGLSSLLHTCLYWPSGQPSPADFPASCSLQEFLLHNDTCQIIYTGAWLHSCFCYSQAQPWSDFVLLCFFGGTRFVLPFFSP